LRLSNPIEQGRLGEARALVKEEFVEEEKHQTCVASHGLYADGDR
jgi:hypothetical protein